MRIIVADCSAVYSGRLNARLPRSRRVILIKEDSSCLIFSELGSYKPLNWMVAPCTLRQIDPDQPRFHSLITDMGLDTLKSEEQGDLQPGEGEAPLEDGEAQPDSFLQVTADKSSDTLIIALWQVLSDQTFDLGQDPGLSKDGVEDHLQHYLAEQIERIGKGARLVRREYPTAIGPVDIMAIDGDGVHVAIEIKRHGGIDGVEQLTRYCKLLNRDTKIAPVRGIFAAQTITAQARTLAEDRGFECLILDYDQMKNEDSSEITLF